MDSPIRKGGPIDFSFFDFNLIDIHLSQLEFAAQFVIDSMPVRIRLNDPDT